MQIASHVEELQRQLAAAAAAGGSDTAEVAARLATALEPAARLAILEALSEAAGEITRELAPGSVDVRLRGRDVDFIVSRPGAAVAQPASNSSGPVALAGVPVAASADEGDDATARTTLRLPDSLKVRAEAAAGAEGLSLNAWLVRAVTASLDPAPAAAAGASSSYTGWVR
ncbi:toxin-antitoxin system HicB family antitoxin [Microbacterium sp. QXD-8]|uniref:Toxin-antitoxin system HicB family antitoxin n=1 Tax=Microbacterium psychrotolerans TaxID=3068321 RepID=A0ABU0YWW3_9MICO|nr:toxin-antitoxin system HicB family antitoxin [Microbacterium sp. QXD-8]MDQ7876802.1 toxin-antitoxin system HicB family antitoxin [Microbacterium sp. QXD-8]